MIAEFLGISNSQSEVVTVKRVEFEMEYNEGTLSPRILLGKSGNIKSVLASHDTCLSW